ncbi:MAG: hypothetical protein ACI4R6_01440 [Lachnospiraceae bacterium]
MNKTNYLTGALYKAKLDLKEKEFEYGKNGMKINFDLSLDEIDCLLQSLESKPVQHGKWIENYGAPNVNRCSVCKAERQARDSWWSYCPNCGAKMGGEQK